MAVLNSCPENDDQHHLSKVSVINHYTPNGWGYWPSSPNLTHRKWWINSITPQQSP